MKSEVLTCDRCGRRQEGPPMAWDLVIAKVKVHTPEDGINGGNYEFDYCAPCRRELHRAVKVVIDSGKAHL